MWWEKKDRSVAPLNIESETPPLLTSRMRTPTNDATGKVSGTMATSQQTVLGQSIILRGDLSASEDVQIEGQFEGTVELEDHRLTVGTTGQVKAEIHARQVVIMGTVSGNISATDKVDIRRTGHVVGDLKSGNVAIEEGAYFKGSIDILRDESREQPSTPPAEGGVGVTA